MNSQTAASSRESQAKPARTSWPTVGANIVSHSLAWFRHWRQVQRTTELLTELDDKMLADIGLMRDQVWHAARHGRLPDWR